MKWEHNPRVRRLAKQMRAGGVCAYPTEAVWGLGCDPFNLSAVSRILALKQRSVSKGLILVAADIQQFEPYLSELSTQQYQLLLGSWPGPNTWLVPHNGMSAPWVHGDFSSVALRVSAHPIVVGLCRAFGGPIVSTSANPQGLNPAISAMDVNRYFNGLLDGIAPGSVDSAAQPSIIRDLETGVIVRG